MRARHLVAGSGGLVVASILLASLAMAQGTAEQHAQKKSFPVVLSKVPAKEAGRPNPMVSDPDAVAAGGKLFGEHCADCHGKSAEGTSRGPSMVSAVMRDAQPGA